MVVLARAICGWDLISYGAGNGFGDLSFDKLRMTWEVYSGALVRYIKRLINKPPIAPKTDVRKISISYLKQIFIPGLAARSARSMAKPEQPKL